MADPERLAPPIGVGASVVCTEQGRRARVGAAAAGGCTRWRVESCHFNRQQHRPSACFKHTRLPSGVVSVLSGVVSVLSRRCAHTKRTRVKRDPHGPQRDVGSQGVRPRNVETRGERAHPPGSYCRAGTRSRFPVSPLLPISTIATATFCALRPRRSLGLLLLPLRAGAARCTITPFDLRSWLPRKAFRRPVHKVVHVRRERALVCAPLVLCIGPLSALA